MNTFDKICAGGAFVLGIVFLVLGALGLFAGSRAQFTLPPVFGVLPAFVGWGILRSVWFAWNMPPSSGQTVSWRDVNDDEVRST
jgi:hypothetical protein